MRRPAQLRVRDESYSGEVGQLDVCLSPLILCVPDATFTGSPLTVSSSKKPSNFRQTVLNNTIFGMALSENV